MKPKNPPTLSNYQSNIFDKKYCTKKLEVRNTVVVLE